MPSKNYRYSSSSFSSSSLEVFENGPSQAISKYPLWDVEESNEELKGEIADLETEILQLERYLLSLYRSSFGDYLHSSLPPSKTKLHNDWATSVSDKSVPSSFKSLSETDKIKRSDAGHPSLADLLGLNTLSPNKLSEEILRLICVIHFELSNNGHNRLVKNSKNEECGQELGVVIHKLYLDDENLKCVESMLQNLRSLVLKLEKVEARMDREEKLAFWINIHNALVMHTLFSPARSSKTSSGGNTYALDYAKPLLHFALSTGASTDPMVRVYTAEGIFQELRQARDVFIQTSVGLEKEKTRILLPKIIYNYAKDTCLDMAELLDTISDCLIATQKMTMRRVVKKNKINIFAGLTMTPTSVISSIRNS